jgi:predicted Zn-dependent peptidase
MGLETTDGIAGFFGAQQLLHGKVETLEDKMEHYRNLTIEDINAVKHLLHKDNLYMYWVE